MAYKYLNLGLAGYPNTTKEQIVNGFQAFLDDQFYNSSTIQTIYEETSFASGSLVAVDARVNRAINSTNGVRLGDDFKILLFKNVTHATGIGYKYYFANNYWITTFSESIMNLGVSCMVRRCNELLRWVGTDGTYYEEPCALEYKIDRPSDTSGAENPVTPQGYFDCYSQLNYKTQLIEGNQRFLFGKPNNRVCFKIMGSGVQNMLRQSTLDENSARLLTISLRGNYINNDTDDLVLGIADKYKDYNIFMSASMVGSYSIVINPPTDYILESGSSVYNVQYYSGSVAQSGSFVFTISGSSVPVANYTFATIDGNNFSVVNNEKWLSNTLDIIASGSSGSRILEIELKGAW